MFEPYEAQPGIFIRIASDVDLEGVVGLQHENLGRNLSESNKQFGGFVSLETPLPLLQHINTDYGITVAQAGDQLAGYLMPMSPQHAQELPMMHSFLAQLASVTVDNRPLADFRYCILGQVCIDHRFRSQGIIEALYENFTRRFSPHFDIAVGEIRADNPRSLRVHIQKLGLELLKQYTADDGTNWCIVALRFRKEPNA